MYKLFVGLFFAVSFFFILLVFPKDSYAQYCGGGSYYCGGYTEYCRFSSGVTCEGWETGCTCTLSCTGNPGPPNSCGVSTDPAICNDLRNYACYETPCGAHSGACYWVPGSGGGGGGGGGCTSDNQCPGCLGCNVSTGACNVQVNAYCSTTCSGGVCLSNGNCSCPATPTPLPACPQNQSGANTIQCQGSCVTDWSPLWGYSCSSGQCCQKNPPSACPGLPTGGRNVCRVGSCNPEETIYGSASNNACGAGQLCCYSETTACPGLPGDGSTNSCVSGSSCPSGTTPYGSLTNNACGINMACCNTPPPATVTECPGFPTSGGQNACITGSSCPSGSTIYGSPTSNACGSGRVCCNTPPSACPNNPPTGGTNACISGASCPSGSTAYGSTTNNACGAGRVCCNTPPGATCASIGGACMASGLSGTQSGCPAGQVRLSQGTYNCSGVTPTCYTCVPAATAPPAVTATPTRTPTPTVMTGCPSGTVIINNVECNSRGVGCCPSSQPYCSSATNYSCSGVENPNTSEIGVFTDTNNSGVYDVGDADGPSVKFLMSNTPNQQPWITGLWSFPSSSYSYFSVQSDTIPSGYQEVSRTGSTSVFPQSRFILLLRQIPPTVTLQGRFVGSNGTTQINLAGQGVSITGLGSKTATPWDYSSIPTGTRTLVINQIPGYLTKYRCRSESSSTCAGIPTTFTNGTQVTVALPTPGSYIDIYVQYITAPSCSQLTRNARPGDVGSAAASGTINAGSSVNLFATIVNDDNNRSNAQWSSTCGTFPSTNWDYATFQAPAAAGTCTISYSLYGVNQPSCSATMTVASVCSGATSTQVISGTVYSDIGNNDCASGSAPITGVSPSFTLISGPSATVKAGPVVYSSSAVPPYRLTDTSSCSTETKTVYMTNLPVGYVVRGYKTTPSTWVPHSAYDVTLSTSANTTLDWCVSNNAAWYQTVSADVRYPNLTNKVPAASVGSQSLSTSPNTPGVFFSSQGTISSGTFGPGAAATVWKVSDEYQYNDDFRNGLGGMSYTFFLSQVKKRNMPTSVISGSTFSFTSATTEQIYTKTGNLTITASGLTTPGKSIVILVDGDVTITGPITAQAGQGNLIVIAASGDITIASNIGSSAALAVTALDGYFTAERNIIIQSNANCATSTSDLRLNVSGALIANSLRPFATGGSGKIQNGRTLCANNTQYPALSVSARPEFLIQLTDFYKTTYKVFKEVNP